MTVFDYIKLVSDYIKNKFENKKGINDYFDFNIKPVRDPYTNSLFYEITEVVNYKNQVFYLKFPCMKKEDFYNAVRQLIIEEVYHSDMLAYTATASGNTKMFSIVTKKRDNINFLFEDNIDELVFGQFKDYLDLVSNKSVINGINKKDDCDVKIKNLKKVQLVQK